MLTKVFFDVHHIAICWRPHHDPDANDIVVDWNDDQIERFLFRKSYFFMFYMVSSCSILSTGFRNVFVFALRPFLSVVVILVNDFYFYIVITMGTPHHNLIW